MTRPYRLSDEGLRALQASVAGASRIANAMRRCCPLCGVTSTPGAIAVHKIWCKGTRR